MCVCVFACFLTFSLACWVYFPVVGSLSSLAWLCPDDVQFVLGFFSASSLVLLLAYETMHVLFVSSCPSLPLPRTTFAVHIPAFPLADVEGLARIGVACLQLLIVETGSKFDAATWNLVCSTLVRLFKSSTPHELLPARRPSSFLVPDVSALGSWDPPCASGLRCLLSPPVNGFGYPARDFLLCPVSD